MKHDVERLGFAAARLTADLHRTLGDAWGCSVSKDRTLTLSGPHVLEAVPLEGQIEDEDWYVRPGFSPQEQAEAFDAAAEDLVANAVSEVLSSLGTPWPICSDHGHVAGNCDGSWYCCSPETHDLGRLGELQVPG